MGNCRSTVLDVIPDRDTMQGVVEMIVNLEEMLKRGETPSEHQATQMKQISGVAREMKKTAKVLTVPKAST